MSLQITVNELALKGGLTSSEIRRRVRNRLSEDHLYDDGANQELSVQITVGEPNERSHFPFYGIDVGYWRYMDYRYRDWAEFVQVWSTGSIGQGSTSFIADSALESVEEFIREYQSVRNSKDCQDFRTRHGAG